MTEKNSNVPMPLNLFERSTTTPPAHPSYGTPRPRFDSAGWAAAAGLGIILFVCVAWFRLVMWTVLTALQTARTAVS